MLSERQSSCQAGNHALQVSVYDGGILREPIGHEQVQGCLDQTIGVYRAVDASDGFHGRSVRDVGSWLHSWGEVKVPKL